PLGVVAIISPWNFPLAIATGMVSSALVAGNTVVFKPAEQSPYVAYKMCELFWNNGLPAGVLNYLTGDGAVVGGRMVEHPQTRFISFTGSKEVGVSIYEKGAKVHPGQKWLKRMILEMGGKDAIIVDETANLDEAAKGIVVSAFGFQGQKCSACSRAIVVESVYEEVTKRVLELTSELIMGAPDTSWKVNMGPVIDQQAVNKITSYINIGSGEGKLLIGGKLHETTDNGY
ncbi:MAG: 1-pyrroline-5-carboxylate dehydrogenase, partial [Phototrophicales bacterium]